MSNSVTYPIWTLTFEWYVIICGSKNKYQKEIELHAQNEILTILTSNLHFEIEGEQST